MHVRAPTPGIQTRREALLLSTHSQWSLEAQRGVVESPAIQNRQALQAFVANMKVAQSQASSIVQGLGQAGMLEAALLRMASMIWALMAAGCSVGVVLLGAHP